MSDQFKDLFNRYLSEERLDCKKYLSHYLMTNRVERPSEYLMDEFVQRALGLEDRVRELEELLKISQADPKLLDYDKIIAEVVEGGRCDQDGIKSIIAQSNTPLPTVTFEESK
jgi:hypothetical protein